MRGWGRPPALRVWGHISKWRSPRHGLWRANTLEVGANVLAGTNPCEIVDKVKLMLDHRDSWENPFGDGDAGGRIVRLLMEKFV